MCIRDSAKTVFVLPNNKNIIMAAEQAQKLADRQVIVLPTRTVPVSYTHLILISCASSALLGTVSMASLESTLLKGRNSSMAATLERVWMFAMELLDVYKRQEP